MYIVTLKDDEGYKLSVFRTNVRPELTNNIVSGEFRRVCRAAIDATEIYYDPSLEANDPEAYEEDMNMNLDSLTISAYNPDELDEYN